MDREERDREQARFRLSIRTAQDNQTQSILQGNPVRISVIGNETFMESHNIVQGAKVAPTNFNVEIGPLMSGFNYTQGQTYADDQFLQSISRMTIESAAWQGLRSQTTVSPNAFFKDKIKVKNFDFGEFTRTDKMKYLGLVDGDTVVETLERCAKDMLGKNIGNQTHTPELFFMVIRGVCVFQLSSHLRADRFFKAAIIQLFKDIYHEYISKMQGVSLESARKGSMISCMNEEWKIVEAWAASRYEYLNVGKHEIVKTIEAIGERLLIQAVENPSYKRILTAMIEQSKQSGKLCMTRLKLNLLTLNLKHFDQM